LANHRNSVNRLEELVGTTRPHFEHYYLETLHRFAAWTQQLPASETHRVAYPGGLLDHGLNVAIAALRRRRGWLLPPEEAALKQDLWTYAVFTLALLHDAAKPAVDYVVTLFDEAQTPWSWNPWAGALGDDPKARWYRVGFRRGCRYTLHQHAAPLLVPRLIRPEGLAWLSTDPALFAGWLAYVAGDRTQAGPFAEILTQADCESVAHRLDSQGMPRTVGIARSLPDRLLIALRQLIDSGELPLNYNGAIGFRVGDDLWLVGQTAADALRTYLIREGQSDIPTNNNRLFDIFHDHDLLVPNAEGRALWRRIVHGDGFEHELTLLRIPVAKVWADPDAAPTEFSGTVAPIDVPPAVLPTRIPEAAVSASPLTTFPEPTDFPAVPASTPPFIADQSPPMTARSLGEAFLDWVAEGLHSGRLEYNTARARVHVVAAGVLLASPGIFKDYAAQAGLADWNIAQKALFKLKVHTVTTAGMNVHRYAILGGATINGVLIADMPRLFGTVSPVPNPQLSPA
jgi:integrating conjugative element relaxase (TIGR03760 family)